MILHKVETSILRDLRRHASARFSELMRPTGLESDSFKFHLRKLMKHGYIHKLENGSYALTLAGKEYANNLSRTSLGVQKQPKLSVILVTSRYNDSGQVEYLFQERLRQPFIHFWGFLSGPVQWGEQVEEAAHRELYKQTGLQANFEVSGICRSRDYLSFDNHLLEDKLFIVMRADTPNGQLSNEWSGGNNAWLTLNALSSKPKVFSSDTAILDLLKAGKIYTSIDRLYGTDY